MEWSRRSHLYHSWGSIRLLLHGRLHHCFVVFYSCLPSQTSVRRPLLLTGGAGVGSRRSRNRFERGRALRQPHSPARSLLIICCHPPENYSHFRFCSVLLKNIAKDCCGFRFCKPWGGCKCSRLLRIFGLVSHAAAFYA